ncbi:MAG: hypothetical protein QG646_4119 [Euryarchaeota archaeon]|nr:hypothetical protein [Euryarchaeota archaeon]
MESTTEIERRLIELDREIHSILNMVRKREGRSSIELVESACGAWGYDIESEEFVDQLRKTSRLDWIE